MFLDSPANSAGSAIGELSRAVANLEQGVDDSVRVDRLRVLEELKSVVAAAQARRISRTKPPATGHTYRSSPPRPPGWRPPRSPLELIFHRRQTAA
jgi:uncharacterized coiled-coil protein SlyX